MMRDTFLSENRIIEVVAACHKIPITLPAMVYREFYYESLVEKDNRSFNVDFRLQLSCEDLSRIDFENGCSGGALAVLPNTLGAEIFLTTDKTSGKPLILELMGGGAFPSRYFNQYLQQIESTIRRLVEKPAIAMRFPGVSVRDFSESVRPDKTQYSRVFIVGQDICFLFFPLDGQPTIRGDRCALVNTEEMQIDCFIEGSKITCIDGWMKTEVADSEYKLVAIPQAT